jgi:Domain of unknown function (DUF4160)
MPVVLRIGPYVFFFFSLENDEPPHIHVQRDRDVANVLAESCGFGLQSALS